jgi:hypothetical protein
MLICSPVMSHTLVSGRHHPKDAHGLALGDHGGRPRVVLMADGIADWWDASLTELVSMARGRIGLATDGGDLASFAAWFHRGRSL